MTEIWSDSPISSADEDSFGRHSFAQKIARLIQNSHSWDQSIVFGLIGPWGSGKSSMLAMIEEELERTEKNSSIEQLWHIAHFTPWATSDINGLLGEFYAALSDALPSDKNKKLREKLGAIIDLAAPMATLIPYIGGTATSGAKRAAARLQKQPSWDKAFKEASEELKKLQTPVLVIADDIDRLHGEELLGVLRVVRLLGRFPGVHFLLAYDQQTVTETLTETGVAGKDLSAGHKFLEKIVQYPLVIPPLSKTQILSRIELGLRPYFDLLEDPRDFGWHLQSLHSAFSSLLSTPRSIDRFLAQTHLHLEIFSPKEVSVEDVIVLTLLKVSFPTLYEQLPRYKDQLMTGNEDGKLAYFLDTRPKAFDISPLLEKIHSQELSAAHAILRALFPNLRERGSVSTYARPRSNAVSDNRYFDRYFAMGVPEYDVSDAEIADAIFNAASGDGKALQNLLLGENQDRVRLVIEKVESNTELLLDDVQRLEVLKAIAPLKIKSSSTDGLLISVPMRLQELAGKILAEVSDSCESGPVLKVLRLVPSEIDKVGIMRLLLARSSGKAWIEEVIESLSAELVPVIVEQIKAKDKAPDSVDVEYLIHVLQEWGRDQLLVSPIEKELAQGGFEVEDVAARFVSISNSSSSKGIQMKLHQFRKEAFDQVVPDAGTQWYLGAEEIGDRFDLSWENRRKFAKIQASADISK